MIRMRKVIVNGVVVEHTINGVAMNAEKKPVHWPIWAKALRQLSKPEDKGIGDVVARIIGDEKSAAFKVWFEMTFGRPCGCNGRQAKWNRLYPL